MSTVYLAERVSDGLKTALKILHPDLADDLDAVKRFKQEARAMSAVAHPNIIRQVDYGQADDGSMFFVTEYLGGGSLADLIKESAPLSPERVIHITSQILAALIHAHSRGIIHRDLKPENLMLSTRDLEEDHVTILDFGIAKILNQDTTMTLTGAGMSIGSPRYMSPEQALGQTVTPRSDLYSLGALVYEMVSGERLYPYKSKTEYIIAHVREPPKPPTIGENLLEGPLIDFVMQCLAKQPDERPASAAEALQMVLSCREEPYRVITPYSSPEPTLDIPPPAGVNTRPDRGAPASLQQALEAPIAQAIELDDDEATVVDEHHPLLMHGAPAAAEVQPVEPQPVQHQAAPPQPVAPIPARPPAVEAPVPRIRPRTSDKSGLRHVPRPPAVDPGHHSGHLRWIIILVVLAGIAAGVAIWAVAKPGAPAEEAPLDPAPLLTPAAAEAPPAP